MKKIFYFSGVSNKKLTLALSVFLVIFYLYQDLANWQLMKYIKAQGPMTYIDTHTVLFYASCFSRIGNDVFAAGTNCANWTYGSGILRFINLIGVNQNDAIFLGHLFTYLIVITFIYCLYLARNFRLAQVVLFLGLISPPVWLIMERANFDSVIYLMIFLLIVLLEKGFKIIPIIIILMSALFKFYTLPLLIIPILLEKKMYVKLIAFLALILGTIIIVSDFKLMKGKIVQAGYNHFGMKIIGNYLGKIGIKLDIISAYTLGAILLIACILLVFLFLSKLEPMFLNREFFDGQTKNLYIFMSSTFLLCFVVGLSVDYRLIFYLVSAPFLIILLQTKVRLVFSGIFLIGAWFCYPSGIFQTVGDLALELAAAAQIIILFYSLFTRNIGLNLNRSV